jgi:alpha-tubulin suppressor-like RCC1 family protein
VWGWGSNMGAPAGGGQLGMDTSVSHGTSVAIKINGLSHIKQITGGGFYTMALLSNNTLVSLGNNYYGQLGVGDTASRHIPAPVVGLTNVKQVSGGWKHVVALRSDSTVWTWGSNLFGQLGTGNTTNSSVPVQVPGLSGFIQVSGGDHHTTALKADGTVWAWGENIRGECGDGTKIQRFSPVQVAGLSGIIYITARDYQNVAIKSDGTLWSWGWDINGQCGIGSTLDTIRVAQKVSVPGCNTANIETLSALRESSVFPNPFSFETTIKISGREKIENAEMNIFDVYGREIRKISGINTSEIKIEKESLSPALYFYEVRNEKSILLGKGKMMIQ